MERESSVSPKLLLLALLLLLFAPVQQLQARELGGSTQAQHVGGLPSVLVLPSGDGDDDAAVVPSKLNALPAVSRPGGLAPPSPAGNPPPHNRRMGPAADLFRVFWDALVRVMS